MQLFHCGHCRHPVYFESHTCVRCGHVLAYLADRREVTSLEQTAAGTWLPAGQEAPAYRLCVNYEKARVCNWAVPAQATADFCAACRLTRIIPDATQPGVQTLWYRLETAKRRVLHGLGSLGLAVPGKDEDPARGLAFDFLADPTEGAPVLTGHRDGVITVALVEADDTERERRRSSLHEPYRTLLGHLRHEVGHYFWERLVRDTGREEDFRHRFGDERADYAWALQRHYEVGPPWDWADQFISAYASAHPWEDWAETWAHYMHMADALETAEASRVALESPAGWSPRDRRAGFDGMIANWQDLAHVLNDLNRSLGLHDAYPFVFSPPVIEKMRFIHELIGERARATGAVQSAPIFSASPGAS